MRLMMCVWLAAAAMASGATEEKTNKTLNASPGGTIVVDIDFGSIDISTNAADKVVVDVWRKITRRAKADEEAFLKENPVQILEEGSTITVRCRRKEKVSWWNSRGSQNEAKYVIGVPSRFHARLNTAGGPIAVSDLSGEVKAQTSGGGLRFTRLQGGLKGDTSGGSIRVSDCSGTIHINTSGGGLDVSGGAGSLDGNTSGGGVMVKDFKGPVHVSTSGGGITIENASGQVTGSSSGGSVSASLLGPVTGDVSLSTSGGGVTVRVPQDAAFSLDAECSGGSVQCELPITVQGRKESHRLKGGVNGGGPTVTLRTSGGGIRVKVR